MASAPAETLISIKHARLKHPIRFVTAASLFDGHDASINIMRRILQAFGVEVIHLGHNRSVRDIVTAALHEDAQAIAVSSYQGGHIEYFKYMVDTLREHGADHVRVFGGGGGVIVPAEILELHAYGVTKIYSPTDGQHMGLEGMIEDMLAQCDFDPSQSTPPDIDALTRGDWYALARTITALENGTLSEAQRLRFDEAVGQVKKRIPVLGITGTGGAGKSSLTDEVIRRFRLDQQQKLRVAILAIDPTRRKTGGALLGDRIRMNAIDSDNIYLRSLATRSARSEVPGYLADIISAVKLADVDLVVVETPGIGQGDAGIVPFVDVALYVMSPEFGAATQLEKIDMLDFADIVAINKFDRKGGADALRDVGKQVQRNQKAFSTPIEEMPVYGGLDIAEGVLPDVPSKVSSSHTVIIPAIRQAYLAEIAETVREYRSTAETQARIARERQQLIQSKRMLQEAGQDGSELDELIAARRQQLDPRADKLLQMWPQIQQSYAGDEYVVKIRDREIRTQLTHTTLSGTRIPKVVLPTYQDHGELLRWLLLENVPGSFPYTAGVFAFKREGEDPTRMFAGEGDAARTNLRFKKLSQHAKAKRLSTAFDSVTLYGWDPDERPDIYGKVGNSGVSIATLDDIKVLYGGFNLCDPTRTAAHPRTTRFQR